MSFIQVLGTSLTENGMYWFVSLFCIYAAYIDGKELKVPNAITFPMIIAGWIFSSVNYAIIGDAWYMGLMWSLAGTAVGLACLYPFYAIGGMGAGDVKMMAAIGAWVHCSITFYAFAITTIVGALMSIIMILTSNSARKHYNQFFMILGEITSVKNPEVLSKIAKERKPTMRLLPYGIPIAIGTIMQFAWSGLLI